MQSIKGVFVAVIFGGILFIAAFPVLYINESNTLTRIQGILKARKDVIPVSADKVDPGNDKKLVHFSGKAETSEVQSDPEFGISENAIRLTRSVEMYQWNESEEDGDDDKDPTYEYTKDWHDGRVDSSGFHEPGHDNPSLPFVDEEWQATLVKVGVFRLNDGLISAIRKPESVSVDLAKVPPELAAKLAVESGAFYLPMSARHRTASETTPDSGASPPLDDNQDGNSSNNSPPSTNDAPALDNDPPPLGNDPSSTNDPPPISVPPTTNDPPTSDPPNGESPAGEPSAATGGVVIPKPAEIGDVRISFQVTRPGPVVSVISGQSEDTLTPYDTVPGADPQNQLVMDTKSAGEMFDIQQAQSDMFTWGLRIGGFVMMLVGLLLIMRPMTALASFVPVLGSIVGFGAFVIAFLMAAALSLITIAVSWVFVRPWIGIPLVVVGVLLIAGAIFVMIKRSQQVGKPAAEGK